MPTIKIETPEGPEEVHLLRAKVASKQIDNDPVKPMKKSFHYKSALAGLVIGVIIAGGLAERYDLKNGGPEQLYTYRLDRLTGRVEYLDRKANCWVRIHNNFNEALDAVTPAFDPDKYLNEGKKKP